MHNSYNNKQNIVQKQQMPVLFQALFLIKFVTSFEILKAF